MAKPKILMVCGAGLGSSFVCQMTCEDVLNGLGVDASLDHSDLSSVGGATADVILAASNFEKQFEKLQVKPGTEVVFIKNIVSKDEIREKLVPVLKDKGFLG